MIFYILLLLFTFRCISWICDFYFVPALEKISKKLQLSNEFAGATLMAVGSSAPELFTSLFAVLNPTISSNLGAGTIVGSALFNILVIVGASVLVRKATITWQPIVRDMLFYSISIIILLLTLRDGVISFHETFFLLGVYILYIICAKYRSTWLKYSEPELIDMEEDEIDQTSLTGKFILFINKYLPKAEKYPYGVFIVSILLIGLATHFMVESAVHIAEFFAIPASIIGLTVLAVGTSIPDLLSSIAVAKKGKGDMAITNAFGSNIFDILVGLGFPYLLFFLIYGTDKIIHVESSNIQSSTLLLFASVLVIIIVMLVHKWTLGKKVGRFLIFLYVAYIIYNIIQVV